MHVHSIKGDAGLEGELGNSTSAELVASDGIGHYQHFQGGSIYWGPLTGAHEVHGLIRDRWSALGWERSALGYPISDETDEVDGSGRFSLLSTDLFIGTELPVL